MSRQPPNHRADNETKNMGAMAVVAMAVCCGIPLLLGATSLAATGLVLGSSVLLIAGVGLCAFAFGRARSRKRRGDDCCDPTVDEHVAEVGRVQDQHDRA